MARVYNFSAGPAVLPEEVLKEDILSKVYDIPVRVLNDPGEGLIILPRIPEH